jgi:hypothetical protein
MTYNGGKAQAGTYHTIINQIPEHATFIECFLGHGAITRLKRPASLTIGVEADASVLQAHWRGDEIPGLQLVHADALTWLLSYDWRGDEFVYADPPYLFDVRSGGQRSLYEYEFGTPEEHTELLRLLKTLPCNVMLSGYWSQLYADELPGWRTLTYHAVKRSGELATEWLWMNYPQPLALHDYRFLGRNFRERERIKRLKQRWLRRLQAMPVLQRQALLAVLHEVADPTTRSGDAVDDPASADDASGGRPRRDERWCSTGADGEGSGVIGSTSDAHRRVSPDRVSVAASIAHGDDPDGEELCHVTPSRSA